MSNGKCHQWPQCLRQGHELGRRDGGKRGNPTLGSAAVGRFVSVSLCLAGQDLTQGALADREPKAAAPPKGAMTFL